MKDIQARREEIQKTEEELRKYQNMMTCRVVRHHIDNLLQRLVELTGFDINTITGIYRSK